MSKVFIEEVTPIRTDLYPDGGMVIDWTSDIGWGQYALFWGEDGKLHAETECLDSEDDKKFTKAILEALVDEIIIDE